MGATIRRLRNNRYDFGAVGSWWLGLILHRRFFFAVCVRCIVQWSCYVQAFGQEGLCNRCCKKRQEASHAYMREVGLPGTPWSVKPSQQKSAKPHALCCQAHAKLVPSKALFLPSWPWAPFLVWRKPTLPCQAIAPSTLYIILICEKKTRSPGRERGITRSPGRERGDSRILSHGRGHWNRKESWPTYNDLEGLLAPGMK